MADPDRRAKQVKRMLRARSTPQAIANRGKNLEGGEMARRSNALRPAGSPARMKAGARISATKLAWCPPHLRPLYRELTQEKRLKAADARALVLEQYETEQARFRRRYVEPGVFVL